MASHTLLCQMPVGFEVSGLNGLLSTPDLISFEFISSHRERKSRAEQDVNAVWLKGIISVVCHTTQSILIAS